MLAPEHLNVGLEVELIGIDLLQVRTRREPTGPAINVETIELINAQQQKILTPKRRLEHARVRLIGTGLAEERAVVEAVDHHARDRVIAIRIDRRPFRGRRDVEVDRFKAMAVDLE